MREYSVQAQLPHQENQRATTLIEACKWLGSTTLMEMYLVRQ